MPIQAKVADNASEDLEQVIENVIIDMHPVTAPS